jgi:hypothetical protein
VSDVYVYGRSGVPSRMRQQRDWCLGVPCPSCRSVELCDDEGESYRKHQRLAHYIGSMDLLCIRISIQHCGAVA